MDYCKINQADIYEDCILIHRNIDDACNDGCKEKHVNLYLGKVNS